MPVGGTDALRPVRIFRDLSDDALAQLAAQVRMRHFRLGDGLIRQGECSDAMYVITEGRVRVQRIDTGTDKPPAVLAELGAGEVVGEMGVLDNQPRSATVVAISNVETLELGAAQLTTLMVHHPEVREALRRVVSKRLRDTDELVARMFADILARSDIFRPVSADALQHLAILGRRRFFAPGDVLMRQDEPSAAMYVIAVGKVRVERSHRDIKGAVVVAHLGDGEVVGEMGILDGAPRSATVVAESHVETMELDAGALSDAMGLHPEIATALLHIVTKRMRSTDALLDHLAHREVPASNGSGNRAPPDPAASRGSPRAGPD